MSNRHVQDVIEQMRREAFNLEEDDLTSALEGMWNDLMARELCHWAEKIEEANMNIEE